MDWIIVIGIVLIVMVFSISLFVFIKSRTKKLSKKDSRIIKAELKKIDNLSNEEKIVTMDKLLDYALGKIGKTGTMHEKLKESGMVFGDINGVFKAHRLRNKIAHEVSVNVLGQEYKEAFKTYTKALKDLGVN